MSKFWIVLPIIHLNKTVTKSQHKLVFQRYSNVISNILKHNKCTDLGIYTPYNNPLNPKIAYRKSQLYVSEKLAFWDMHNFIPYPAF